MTLTRSPFLASEGGRLPETSARPPVLQNGTASLVTYRIFTAGSLLRSDHAVLFHSERIILVPDQRSAAEYMHVFVGNDALERDRVLQRNILEKHAGVHLAVLSHLHAGEEDAVRHVALNDAAVADERVDAPALRREIGRRLVRVLGLNGPRGT